AEGVLGVVAAAGALDRLADGDAEAAGAVGMLGEDAAADLGGVARSRQAGGAEGLHVGAPVRLLVIAHTHHEHLDLEAEYGAGESERRAPLPGAGLGADPPDTLFLAVEGLGDGGVGLVAAGGADALVLV